MCEKVIKNSILGVTLETLIAHPLPPHTRSPPMEKRIFSTGRELGLKSDVEPSFFAIQLLALYPEDLYIFL